MSRLRRTKTRLERALADMGIVAEIETDGRWARFRGESCDVYVVETSHGRRFLTWCDCLDETRVESLADPDDAIRTGLRRARRKPS